MTFPLWYLLIPYAVFALITALFLFFNLYHIVKFGLQATKTTVVLAVYVFGFLAVMIFTLALLSAYDWNVMVDLSQYIPSV